MGMSVGKKIHSF